MNITESKNCVIVDATCRNGPNDWRLYDLVFYDFNTAKPLVSRFNSDGSADAIHHVTLVDDGSSDSQMMRFARAIDKVSSFEDFSFLFNENVVAMVEGSDSYKRLLCDFDEYGPRGIVVDLMTNAEYLKLVEGHQDLDYAIANLREKQMMDVSKSENENKGFTSIDDYDF